MGVDDRIKKIFTDIQLNTHGVPILVKSMKNVFNLLEYEKFKEDFIFCTKKFMMVLKRDSHIERGIDFISKFTASFANAGQGNKENNGDTEAREEEDEEEEDMHPFTMHFFNFIISCQDAQSKSVRFRACQLIEKLLSDLGDGALIEDDLYDKIYADMLKSVYDKCHAVRIHAALALTRLQDPENPDCLVVEAYVKLLTCDPNPEVRKAVLVSIAACKRTVKAILDKTLDVNTTIRKLAFKVISEKIHIKALTIVQRVTLIRRGINDRSESVTEACMNLMVKMWLSNHQDDIISLLSSLYCQNYHQECQKFLELWFTKTDPKDLIENFKLLDERTCIPVEKLTPENSFYWRMLCQHIVNHPSLDIQGLVDKVIPTCLQYVSYLQELVADTCSNNDNAGNNNTTTINEEVDKSFKLLQVVKLMSHLDVSDETGRKAVLDIIRTMLLSMSTPSDQIVPSLVEQYLKLHQSCDKEVILARVSAIITDIMRPDFQEEAIIKDAAKRREIEIKLASNKVQLIYQQDLLEDSVSKQLFQEAVTIKQRIGQLNEEKIRLTKELNKVTFGKSGDEEDDDDVANTQTKNDPETIIRCLRIVSKMLANKRFDKLTPTILSIIDELVIPGITSKDTGVREVAVECLGLCCVRDLEKGRQFVPLFIQVILVDVDEVKVFAIKAIFNLLLIFGLPVVQTNKNKKTNNSNGADNGSAADNGCGDVNDPMPDFLMEENSKTGTDNEDDEEEDVWNKILNILTEFLNSDSVLRTVSCEGLCKLLMVNRIDSPGLLSRLFLLWYNPLTEDDPKLRQFLSFFFISYAQKSRANQEIISETYLPTIKFLLQAPRSSPLSKIKVENVAELLIHLSDSEKLFNFINQESHVAKQKEPECGPRPHDELAIMLCNELLKETTERTAVEVKLYTRTLLMLNISMENRDILQSLRGLIKKIFKTRAVTDRNPLKSLSKVSKEVKLALQKFIEPGLDLSQIELDESKDYVISSGTTTTQTSESVMDVTMQYDKGDNGDGGNGGDGGNVGDGGSGDIDDIVGGDKKSSNKDGVSDMDDDDDDISMDVTLKANVSKKSSGKFNVSQKNENGNHGDDEDEDDDDDFEPVSTSRLSNSIQSRNNNSNNNTSINNNNNNTSRNNNNNNTSRNSNNNNNTSRNNNNISRMSMKRKHYTTYGDDEDDDDDDDDDIVESDSDDDDFED